MKKLDIRYSKILLILLGVLAAIVIGFQSNAVGFNANHPTYSPWETSKNSVAEISSIFHFKWLTVLK